MMFNKFVFSALSAAVLVAGCSGSDPAPVVVAGAPALVAIGPANGATVAAAVVNTTFTFPSGAAVLQTTAPTTVAFTGTGATPPFRIAAGQAVATGTTSFGSCIFLIQNSTFVPPSPLVNGASITVNPCNLTVNTSGLVAGTTVTNGQGSLTLGTATSTVTSVGTVTVAASGNVSLNNQPVGTVTTIITTGGG